MNKQKQIQTRLSTTTDIVLLEEHAKMPSVFCASISRIFFTPISVDPDTTVLIVLAACIVYNFLRDERSSSSCDETPSDVMDLPRNIQPLPRTKGNADFEVYNVRNQFRKYFCSWEGQVAWQLAHVDRVN